MLHLVDEVILYLDLPDSEKIFDVFVGVKLKKVITGSFETNRLYKVLHHSFSDIQWSAFDAATRKSLQNLYRESEQFAYYALMFWTGGFVGRAVESSLDELLKD